MFHIFLLCLRLHPCCGSDPIPEKGHVGIHGGIISNAGAKHIRCGSNQLPLVCHVAHKRSPTVAVAGTTVGSLGTYVVTSGSWSQPFAALVNTDVKFLKSVWSSTTSDEGTPAGDPTVGVATESFSLVADADGADVVAVGISILVDMHEGDIIWISTATWIVLWMDHHSVSLVAFRWSLAQRLDVMGPKHKGIVSSTLTHAVSSGDQPSAADETRSTDVVRSIDLETSLPWIFAHWGVTSSHDVGKAGAEGWS